MAYALYGLQGIDDKPISRMVIAALADCTDFASDPLSAQSTGMALLGLHRVGLDCGAPIRNPVVSRAKELESVASELSSADLCSLVIGSIATLEVGYAGDPDSLCTTELRRVYEKFSSVLSTRTPSERAENITGGIETTFRRLAMEAFVNEPNVQVHPTSRYLYGFEADIVLTIQVKDNPPVIVNVEVDGARHREAIKRRISSIRDAHLLKMGVKAVVRWDASAERRAPSPDEFKDWIRGGVTHLIRREMRT